MIEADGARQKPLKAWAEHEPVIPAFVDQVVHVTGLSRWVKPLQQEYVHRPEIFSRLSGLAFGEAITTQAILKELTHPDGGLKILPDHARRVVLLNQAEPAALQSIANGMVQPLLAALIRCLLPA